MIKTTNYQDLKPVLMEPGEKKVKVPAYLIEGEDQVIFVVSSGCNGAEFNKTIGYINNLPTMQTYFALYGSGILLMQRNDETGGAKEFKMVRLSPLKQAVVPAGWAMCLVNTGNNFLVVLRNSLLDKKCIDTKPIIEKGGFAYYVVEKKGEIVFEQNPRYSNHPQITTE